MVNNSLILKTIQDTLQIGKRYFFCTEDNSIYEDRTNNKKLLSLGKTNNDLLKKLDKYYLIKGQCDFCLNQIMETRNNHQGRPGN